MKPPVGRANGINLYNKKIKNQTQSCVYDLEQRLPTAPFCCSYSCLVAPPILLKEDFIVTESKASTCALSDMTS